MDKIALIGNGYWGSKIKKYIPEFFELKYTANSKFDKDIIWKDKEIDGVIVATPMETHYEIVKEALQNGKHVFSEKPITLYPSEAKELKQIAYDNGLYLGVDYTQTFSPSIMEMLRRIDVIGDLKYTEMSTKHLGRFMDFDVYWLLVSHHLSVLDMFIDLDTLRFTFDDHLYNGDICTTGSIIFEKGRIDVSLNFPGKEMFINLYGTKGTIKYNPLAENSLQITIYNKGRKLLPDELTERQENLSFDEKNNLRYAVKYFRNLMNGGAYPNINRAIKITRILYEK